MGKKIKKAISAEIMAEEYSRIINEIVDLIHKEDGTIGAKIRVLSGMSESLDKLAGLAESRIKREQIKIIRLGVAKILKSSSNKLLIAAIDGGGN
jgi:hypothetical protein